MICPRCGHDNMPGVLVCEKCHMALSSIGTTRQIPTSSRLETASAGTVKFPSFMRLLLQIGDTKLDLRIDDQLTVGRYQEGQNGKPDIDLASYDGFAKGVSRWHALFKRTDQMLSVTDTGSVNGTWVNGQQLRSGTPRILSDGDSVWFGQLRVDVYFYYV